MILNLYVILTNSPQLTHVYAANEEEARTRAVERLAQRPALTITKVLPYPCGFAVTPRSRYPGYIEVDEMGKVVAQGDRYVEGWEQFIRDELQSLSRQANGSRY